MNAHEQDNVSIYHRALAKQLALVPALVEPAPLFTDAAIAGGCGPCGGFCSDCLPDPITNRDGSVHMPAGWAPTAAQMNDRNWIAAALLKGCIQDIYSEITPIPAASTVEVRVQPSQHTCFVGLRESMVARLDTDLTLTVAAFGRAFVGDCPQDYQASNITAFTDFKHSDDCNWCPIPEVDLGRIDDNEDYHRAITNLLPGTAIRFQIAIRGIPYANRGCWRGWRVRDGGSSCSCNGG